MNNADAPSKDLDWAIIYIERMLQRKVLLRESYEADDNYMRIKSTQLITI